MRILPRMPKSAPQSALVIPHRKKYARKKLLAIEAAARVFAEKGFHGATTQDIAAQMGIQQGSLYYYFKSKEQRCHLKRDSQIVPYVKLHIVNANC